MCVIIYIPKGESISKKEIKKAWKTNPDGAGYMQTTGTPGNEKTLYKRGFMTFKSYWENIKHKIGRQDLILHLRISTSNKINQLQTHPYEAGHKTRLQGVTTAPVICMNGVIYQQPEYTNFNDTMSYIQDHLNAFKVINQDILNIITSDTGAKWAALHKGKVLISENFTKYKGRYYSNINHIQRTWTRSPRKKHTIQNTIKTDLLQELEKNWQLYDDTYDYIEYVCNQGGCYYCPDCLSKANTLQDIQKILWMEEYY